MFKRALGFVAAATMSTSAVMAQSAAPLSVAPAVRASADTGEESELTGAPLVPILVFAAIIIGGVLLATGVFDDDDSVSP